MTRTRRGALVALLCIAACATPPRVTTEAERAKATAALNLAHLAFIAASEAGAVQAEHVPLASQQFAALRLKIAESATVPLDMTALLLEIAQWHAQWKALADAKPHD